MKEKDYRRHGLIGTIIFHAIILLLLIIFGMQSIRQEEEGLLVNFGTSESGSGMVEPRESSAEKTQTQITPPPPSKSEPSASESTKEPVNTQDYEEAAALKEEQQKKAEQKRQEAERKRKEAIEAQKKREAEELARKAAEEAERKRQEEMARQKAEAQSRVKNAFGSKGSGSSTSEGETKGAGNQGYATGDPNSKNRSGSGQGASGSGYSLAGRSLSGSLPKPKYDIQEEGIVVVEITVDRNGNVTNATPILKGTTTTNSYLWREAKNAALKAKFNADSNAPVYQKGTITYHFVLD